MPSPNRVTSLSKRQPQPAVWVPRSLLSGLFQGDKQLQKTINGGNESAIGLGASGLFVLLIQKALCQLGYGRFLKTGADGKFGDQTRQATEQFQQENQLSIDGVVGRQTLEKLDLLIAWRESAIAWSGKAHSASSSIPLPQDEESLPLRPVSLGTLKRVGTKLSGKVSVSPEVGLSILDNMAKTAEHSSFLPEKGAVGQ